jgi:hypothetical protein
LPFLCCTTVTSPPGPARRSDHDRYATDCTCTTTGAAIAAGFNATFASPPGMPEDAPVLEWFLDHGWRIAAIMPNEALWLLTPPPPR